MSVIEIRDFTIFVSPVNIFKNHHLKYLTILLWKMLPYAGIYITFNLQGILAVILLTFRFKSHILCHLMNDKSWSELMLRYLLVCLTLICLFSILTGCSNDCKEGQSGSADIVETQTTDSLVIVLKGQEGKSVFEISELEHKIDFISSIAGKFVEAIDSIEINSTYGWMYSVNDTMGQVASDKYITKDGDIIRWHFRKF